MPAPRASSPRPFAALAVLAIVFALTATEPGQAEQTDEVVVAPAAKGEKPKPEGRYREARARSRKPMGEEAYQQLIGLGYLQGYASAPASSGVTVLDTGRTQPGVNLVVSAHSPSAQLMGLGGKVLHEWRYKKAYEIWPDFTNREASLTWRRAYVYPNGDLLAIYEYAGLVKLDKDSNLLWKRRGERHAHHDLEVVGNQLIYVLTAQKRVLPEVSEKEVLDEYITVLGPSGKVWQEHSILELIANSPYSALLKTRMVKQGGFFGHVLHVNTLEVFDGSQARRSPIFRRGNVLISILMMDTIAIADLKEGELVWAYGKGNLSRQHQPTLLSNGNILVFDNWHGEDCSRVIELDPVSEAIAWEYDGCDGESLYSSTCGTAQRLENGNTLITETDNGRAFEVTPEHEIVWEYVNPHRAGDDDELIATLLEVVRIDWRAGPFLKVNRPAKKPKRQTQSKDETP